jgi:GT2 family glycosyltransferase
MERAGVSLVVSALNEGERLRETLSSVLAGGVAPRELVVVDDGSTDGSCDPLKAGAWAERGVRVISTARQGIARARASGCRAATQDVLVILDGHCEVERDWLARLLDALARRPGAIVAPAICDIRDPDFHGCGAALIGPQLRYQWGPASETAEGEAVPIVPGGCFALTRAVYAKLGGFDEGFREFGIEDVEFSLRAWRLGIESLAAPAARLSHLFRVTPPYAVARSSLAHNVARCALIHFKGARRDACLRSLIGQCGASEALVNALAGDWEARAAQLEATSSRSIEDYFETFGDWE